MCAKCMLVLKFAVEIKGISFPVYFVFQEKKFQCEAIVEKFGILNSLLELLELCQANLVQIKLMGNSATTPVYVYSCISVFLEKDSVYRVSLKLQKHE